MIQRILTEYTHDGNHACGTHRECGVAKVGRRCDSRGLSGFYYRYSGVYGGSAQVRYMESEGVFGGV